MLDAFEHWANQRLRFEADDAGDATHKLNLKRAALAQRIEHAESRSRRRCQFFETDWRRTTREYAFTDPFYLWPLPLVLNFPGAKVVEHKTLARTKNLDPFFRQRLIALTQIGDRAVRAVGKTQRD